MPSPTISRRAPSETSAANRRSLRTKSGRAKSAAIARPNFRIRRQSIANAIAPMKGTATWIPINVVNSIETCIHSDTLVISLHVHLKTFLLDDAGELLRLGVHEVGELLRCAVVGAGAHGDDVLLDVVAFEHRLHLKIERLEHGGGRAFGQEYREPG